MGESMNTEDLRVLLKSCGCQDWEIEDEFERNHPQYLADIVTAKAGHILTHVVGWDENFVEEVLNNA